MTSYLIRRVLQMIAVILVSAAASYALLNFAPGGPLAGLKQITQSSKFRITEEDFARIRAYFELDLSVPIRFTRWLIGEPRGPIVVFGRDIFANVPIGCYKEVQATVQDAKGNLSIKTIGCKEYVYLKDLEGRRTSNGVLRGDFGNSWKLNRDRPVAALLTSRLPKTIQLSGLAVLLSLVIGLPLGVYSAVKQYSRFDYIFTTLAFMGSAMPTFFFGILAITLFSVLPYRAGWFYLPAGSSVAVRDYTVPLLGVVKANSGLDVAMHLALPVLVLTLVSVAGWSRYVRGSMLEVLRQDYV
ncbi:MAG TPA: ABC transporter permease, partial [Anaerolinea sp.]|nr:ABC transporter permease [Anaerolinea sp.]